MRYPRKIYGFSLWSSKSNIYTLIYSCMKEIDLIRFGCLRVAGSHGWNEQSIINIWPVQALGRDVLCGLESGRMTGRALTFQPWASVRLRPSGPWVLSGLLVVHAGPHSGRCSRRFGNGSHACAQRPEGGSLRLSPSPMGTCRLWVLMLTLSMYLVRPLPLPRTRCGAACMTVRLTGSAAPLPGAFCTHLCCVVRCACMYITPTGQVPPPLMLVAQGLSRHFLIFLLTALWLAGFGNGYVCVRV